jgi:hypothetical protein
MINYTSDLSGSSTIGKAERWISLMRRALVWVSGWFTITVRMTTKLKHSVNFKVFLVGTTKNM